MVRQGLLAGLVLILSACGDPYEQGRQAFEQGDWEKAIERLQQVRRLSADHDRAQGLVARAHFQLGREAYERQDWDAALQWLEKLELVKMDWDRYPEVQLLLEQVKEAQGAAGGEVGEP